jgi:Tol biopolymer transport system component
MKRTNIVVAILALFLVIPAVSYAGTYQLISVSVDGTSGNGQSSSPVISADGRYIAFTSEASDLVDGDINGYSDAFVYDVQTGGTDLISRDPYGVPPNRDSRATSISADGRFVVFYSPGYGIVHDIPGYWTSSYVRDIVNGETFAVYLGEALFLNHYPTISGDGRYMTFSGYSNYQVPYNTEYCIHDLFVVEIETGDIICIENSEGLQSAGGPSISGDGTLVAFLGGSGYSGGRYSVLVNDIYLADLVSGEVQLMSKAGGGGAGNFRENSNPVINADGSLLAYTSKVKHSKTTVSEIFIRDTPSGKTKRLGPGYGAAISADGRYVAYLSNQSGNTSLYLYDRSTRMEELVSHNALAYYRSVSFSGNGRYIAFTTSDSLVPADDNDAYDVYLYDRGPQ